MESFGHNLGRRLGLFRGKRRHGSPARLQNLQADIEEDLMGAVTPSPLSKISVTSSAWVEEQENRGVRLRTGLDPGVARIVGLSQHEAVEGVADTSGTVRDASIHGVVEATSQHGIEAPVSPHHETDASAESPHEYVDEPALQSHEEETQETSPEDQQATFADQQAIRQGKYVTFAGEDETDYTAGPSRIVYASDGVQAECGALLLTLDLSATIQGAIQAQRNLSRVQRAAILEDDANEAFERKLRRQIARHEHRIAELEGVQDGGDDGAESSGAGGAEDNEARSDGAGEMSVLRAELSKLHLLVENKKAKRQGIAADVAWKLQMFREAQTEVNAYLEEAFVFAALLGPAVEELEEPIEELDVEAEYQKICRMAQEDAENEPLEVAPLHRCDDDEVVPLQSPEEQAKSELKDAYWQAQQELEGARVAFNRRTETRALEEQANEVAVARGEQPRDATPLDFDLRWVVRNQELTHDIINAEEALAQTKEACLEAGVQLVENDQESGFADHASDGYRESSEAAWIASAQGDEKVVAWLDGLPDPDVSFVEREEVKEVESERDESDGQSVSPSDSNSLGNAIAGGSRRRRIDKWREICGW